MVRPDFLPVTVIVISLRSGKAVFQRIVQLRHVHSCNYASLNPPGVQSFESTSFATMMALMALGQPE